MAGVALLNLFLTALVATACLHAQSDFQRRLREGLEQERAGLYSQAVVAYKAAHEIAERSGATDLELSALFCHWGHSNDQLGLYTAAESRFKKCFDVVERLHGRQHADVAVVLRYLAQTQLERSQSSLARNTYVEALSIQQKLFPAGHAEIAVTEVGLGISASRLGDLAEAEKLLVRAAESLERQPETGSKHLVAALNNLSVVRTQQGRQQEAVELLERTVRIHERTKNADAVGIVRSINNLACAYAEMKRTGEAEAAFQKGLKLAEERLGPEHRDTGGILYSYSTLLRSTGRKAEARKMELRWKLIQEDTARVNGLGLTLDARNVRRP